MNNRFLTSNTKPAETPYVFQEFPKWKHPQTPHGKARLVNDPDEEAALGEGWGDYPYAPATTAAFDEPEEPTAAPVVRRKVKQPAAAA